MLPPGQVFRKDFPRFGLPQFTERFPSNTTDPSFALEIDDKQIDNINLSLTELPRHSIISDFHCVTTWSHRGLEWSGVRVSALLEKYLSQAELDAIEGVILYSQDGYKTTLIREDLLADQVIVADKLNGEPLTVEHGAPLRLVAPGHYGYKNPKHLSRMELYSSMPVIKRGLSAFLDHPRARVDKEERSRWIPGWILRYLYRMLIPGTVKDYAKAMRKYNDNS